MREPSRRESRGGTKAGDAERAPACPAPSSDAVCSDEVKHGRQLEDPAMLDGSILDVGSGIAGVMDVELPTPDRGESDALGGCDSCER